MIKVCPKCFNINLNELKNTFKEETIVSGCIDICEYQEKMVYGKVNGKLIKADSFKNFITEAKKILDVKN